MKGASLHEVLNSPNNLNELYLIWVWQIKRPSKTMDKHYKLVQT